VRLHVARGGSPADVEIDAFAKFGYELSFADEKPVPALLEADLRVSVS
jgi:hypothetical protein